MLNGITQFFLKKEIILIVKHRNSTPLINDANKAKYIFISPEYNGSIPGVLKCLIDVSDVRRVWKGKKALLTGVSTGRAGNLRGMDHLTGILHFVGTVVHPNKLPISVVDTLFNENRISHQETLRAINRQLDEFVEF